MCGGCAWPGGMCGQGHAWLGGVRGQGACVAGGHVWSGGTCMPPQADTMATAYGH